MTNNIDYSPDSLHMAVRAGLNIGYTGTELDCAMAEFVDTVQSDYDSGNFDPDDSDRYIVDGNTQLMAERWEVTRGLVGEVWNNGGWDCESGTLDEIVYTALEELACDVVRVMADILSGDDD